MVRSRRKQQNDIRTHCCRGWKEDAVQAGPLNVIGQNGSRIFRRYTEQARRKMRRFLTDVRFLAGSTTVVHSADDRGTVRIKRQCSNLPSHQSGEQHMRRKRIGYGKADNATQIDRGPEKTHRNTRPRRLNTIFVVETPECRKVNRPWHQHFSVGVSLRPRTASAFSRL